MSLNTELKRYARLVAKDAKAGVPSAHSRLAMEFMEDNPNAVLGVIELARREANRKKPNGDMLEAYGYMFRVGLEQLRYQVERGYGWAEELVDEARELLLTLASGKVISSKLLIFLLNGFVDAKLDPGAKLTDLAGELTAEEALSGPSFDPSDLTGLLDSLVEDAGGNEFQLHAALGEVGQALPPEFRQTFVELAATSRSPVMRDTAILYLLDSSPEVRQTTCRVIAEQASPSSVSPTALRRMIAVRNWLPEDQRSHLDSAIKKTRQGRVACASWPRRDVAQILVSHMDGAGAQSVFGVVKDGRKHVVASLLVKQGVGIADAWCLRDQSKADVTDFLGQIEAEMECVSVNLEFLHLLVPHYLAVGHKAGNVPVAGFLDFVESLGIEKWQPAALSAAEMISLMEKDVDRADFGRDAIDDAVDDSADWLDELAFAESWFEDDAEVTAVLSKQPPAGTSAKANAIFKSILEPRRDKWAERFLWTALLLKQNPDSLSPWKDFFIVGRDLHRGRPVADIPAMRSIAEVSMMSHLMRS